MAGLCKKVKELKGTFQLFQIRHVLRVGITYFLCLLTLFGFLLDKPALWFAICIRCTTLNSSFILFFSAGTYQYIVCHAKFNVDNHIINSQKIPVPKKKKVESSPLPLLRSSLSVAY